MMKTNRHMGMAALVLALVPGGVAAQGGGAEAAPPTPAPVPASASASAPARPQGAPISLSLRQALGLALTKSEEVRGAAAQVDQAEAGVKGARSAALPKVNTQLSYNRTLRSAFQGSGLGLPDSMKFTPDPNASVEDRLSYLEKNAPLAGLGGLSGAFSNLPFGKANTWQAGVTVTQPLYAGGQIRAGINAAEAGAEAAQASLDEAKSQIVLDVKKAYYDAALADQSARIVEASARLAREHLAQVKLQKEAGRVSDLEAMRAEVDAKNLEPQLVQANNARDVALLNLKRLINVPMDTPVELATKLEPDSAESARVAAVSMPSPDEAAPRLQARGAIAAAEHQVDMRKEQVSAAKGAYLPSVALQGSMARQAYPTGAIPGSGDWRDDWSVGITAQWSPFQGFKRSADVEQANAQVTQSELQLDQLRESVRMEYDQALGELKRAQTQVGAAQSTVAQAQRVYDLTEMRYREGLATQLDVSNARLSLQQAQLNQVQALHDVYVATARAERALGTPVDRSVLPAG
ncbi:MAG TPA: TolC family protein [Longimicrobiales bacterium]|nr:TolC family protein [Longimicrobiales bacterium]